jgi:pyridoxamine 5'-phosphate oxidase
MSSPASLRKDYKQKSLSEADIASDPMAQFDIWWQEALASEIDEVNAMTLATAGTDGMPDARIVLLKGFDPTGFVFYTNYESSKGRQLELNPKACLVFFWKELERQVRIYGMVERTSALESDTYFNSRPRGSRIGAWVSPQSSIIGNRNWLEKQEDKWQETFKEGDVPRPAHWGGFRVKPFTVEFWQGRPNRLHDRLKYTLEGSGQWKIERLAP